MLFCNNNKYIFHIHIPRTGGRYIRNIFEQNYYQTYHNNFEYFVQGIETPHLHYPLYNILEDIDRSSTIHFAVVRDPFERFKSSMQLVIKGNQYPIEIYDQLKDKDWLFNFLDFQRNVTYYHTNLFRPQHEFISEKTLTYKFEHGLQKNFLSWANDNMSTNLINKNFSYTLGLAEELKNPREIFDDVKPLIKEYYIKDYATFNYQ